jgi:hypothetical protein
MNHNLRTHQLYAEVQTIVCHIHSDRYWHALQHFNAETDEAENSLRCSWTEISVSAFSVYFQCLLSVSTFSVYFQCLLSVSTFSVYFQCLLSVSTFNIYFQCLLSVSTFSVYVQCLLSVVVVAVVAGRG